MRFNVYASLAIIVLILLYNNMRLHDKVLDLQDQISSYGKCELMTSKQGGVVVQHCIRTIYKH